jgi:hypothetical protein
MQFAEFLSDIEMAEKVHEAQKVRNFVSLGELLAFRGCHLKQVTILMGLISDGHNWLSMNGL